MRRCPSADKLAAAGTPSTRPQRRPAYRAGLALHLHKLRLVRLPDEMWGMAALTVRLGRSGGKERSLTLQPVYAAADAIAAPPPQADVSLDQPKSIAEALEFQPQLTTAQELLTLVVPALACATVYFFTAPATVQLAYSAGMALLYACLVAASRMWLLEQQYALVQRSEKELAGSAARFLRVGSCEVHYTVQAPQQHAPRPTAGTAERNGTHPPPGCLVAMHCLHGFGASAFSWSFVQSELSRALGALVTAHDMPGFGLTTRPRGKKYYTMLFNGSAARSVMDAELARQGLAQTPEPAGPEPAATERTGGTGSSGNGVVHHEDDTSLGRAGRGDQAGVKRVLLGHSMGAAAVAEGVIANPEGVTALVLVAPAIVALWAGPHKEARADALATGLAVVEELVEPQDALGSVSLSPTNSSETFQPSASATPSSSSSSNNGTSAAHAASDEQAPAPSAAATGTPDRRRQLQQAQRVARVAAAVAQAALFSLVRLLLLVATPALVWLLRRVVRSRSFWQRGLMAAWQRKAGVTRHLVNGYRMGLLVRGWELGIVRFLSGRFAEKLGFWGAVTHALLGDGHLTQAERLARVIRRHGIRVLIVHGAQDSLVPLSNSRRLTALLPGAQLVEFGNCGHMPQEEMPDRFVQEVTDFVRAL